MTEGAGSSNKTLLSVGRLSMTFAGSKRRQITYTARGWWFGVYCSHASPLGVPTQVNDTAKRGDATHRARQTGPPQAARIFYGRDRVSDGDAGVVAFVRSSSTSTSVRRTLSRTVSVRSSPSRRSTTSSFSRASLPMTGSSRWVVSQSCDLGRPRRAYPTLGDQRAGARPRLAPLAS
jgi:hypothetical protein